MNLRAAVVTRSARRDYAEAVSLWLGWPQDSEGRVAEVQFKQLQEVWRECQVDVIYYRNLVERGEAPAELRSWDDLRNIPLLERKTLQEHREEFRRISGPPDEYRMTGGSTGTPVRLGVWKEESHPQRVAKLVLWHRCGYEPARRLFLIWGHSHLLGTGVRGNWNHLLRKAKDGMLGYHRVDAYSLSPERCAAIAKELIRFRPFGLIGYASALDYFVRVTEPYHEQFRALGLGFVMPASEMLPRNDSLDLLGGVFKCPVIQEYGGVEFGQVAMKHHSEPFRVFPYLNYVEAHPALEAGSDGEKLFVTSLTRRYVPLIRYAPGDAISGATRLDTGHVLSFDGLKARLNDMLTLPGGVVVHSVGIFHCIHQEKAVLNIQLVLADSGMKLSLATTTGYDDGCEQRIRRRLAQISPELGRIPFQVVVDVQTTVAGKRRWIVDERSNREPSLAGHVTARTRQDRGSAKHPFFPG